MENDILYSQIMCFFKEDINLCKKLRIFNDIYKC